mgnify:FL=1
MKKKYIAPASLVIEMQTSNMLALSQVNDGTTINKGNEGDFEQYSNKQNSMWGESGNKKGLWD